MDFPYRGLVAIFSGIIILVQPKLLPYIIAVYLIFVGAMQLIPYF